VFVAVARSRPSSSSVFGGGSGLEDLAAETIARKVGVAHGDLEEIFRMTHYINLHRRFLHDTPDPGLLSE
jgi:hypothetical protein